MSARPSFRIESGRGRDLDQAALERQARAIYADSHVPQAPPAELECLWILRGPDLLARCTLGVAHDLARAPGATGWIGWYEAQSSEAGAALLGEACARHAARGVSRVLGPLHGSTWQRYRLALPSAAEDAPFFLGEPRNPFTYPLHFLDAGFSVAAGYESRVVASDAGQKIVLPDNYCIRSAEGETFDRLLERLYALSLDAFADNAYYSPIGREEFDALYEPVRRLFDPALVLLLEDALKRLVGFLFSYPNVVGAAQPRELVAKTMAVAPTARGKGLGRAILSEIGRVAGERGYAEVIHALMHVDNRSQAISSSQGARLLRSYALYEWKP